MTNVSERRAECHRLCPGFGSMVLKGYSKCIEIVMVLGVYCKCVCHIVNNMQYRRFKVTLLYLQIVQK